MNLRIVLMFVLFFMSSSLAESAIIFTDNFDSQADWTYLQGTSADTHCWIPETPTCSNPATQPPTNWTGWYNGFSHCSDGPGNNNMYIDAIPGYPVESSGTCYGGSGNCLTFWDESCSAPSGVMQDSDGNIGYNLGSTYPEVYIRWRFKFSPTFQWLSSETITPQHKILHIQYYTSGSPWSYGDENPQNRPYNIPGFTYYSGTIYYYNAYRCEEAWKCTGTPSLTMTNPGDYDYVSIGTWGTTIGDGNWHTIMLYYKMNSSVGIADGVHTVWLDGSQIYTRSDIPWADQGADSSPMRGWRAMSFGGNNNNAYQDSGAISGREQWYAIDDIVVATTYQEAVDGSGGGGSAQGCTISGGNFR